MRLIFRLEDPEGLIALGAPEDEYDSEADELQTELDALDESDITRARVSSIIINIWQDYFGPFTEEELRKRQPVLQRLVQRILNQRCMSATLIGTKQTPSGSPFRQ